MKFPESREKDVWRGPPNRSIGLCRGDNTGRDLKEYSLCPTPSPTDALQGPTNWNPEDKRAH